MANEVATRTSVKSFLKSDEVQQQVKATLGAKSSGFTASVLALVGQDALLAQAVPATVFSAALTAAALDLPINKSLGFAHIIGYKNNSKGGIVEAQFQMGWKGFVQLAQRSGHYKTINTEIVHEGEIKSRDRLSGEIEFDWKEDSERADLPVIGYVAYFRLTTGFEKTLYMSVEEVEAHATRYSQSYKLDKSKGWTSSNWSKNFDAMALKTVVKQLISKWGPMSTELEKAMLFDQSIIKGDQAEYADGVDLDTVSATDEEEDDIVDAQGDDAPEGEVVPPKDSGDATGTEGEGEEEAAPAPAAKKVEPVESVKDKAARKYINKGKQASLVNDDEASDDN